MRPRAGRRVVAHGAPPHGIEKIKSGPHLATPCFPSRPHRELSRRLAAMVLRRTAEVNAKYLPPCDLYVVFCRPTPLQLRCYSAVLGSTSVRSLLTSSSVGDQVGGQARASC